MSIPYYLVPDKYYLKWKYKKEFGTSLDLLNPQKFSEKIQWLKLYDRKEFYHCLVDKFRVKNYISQLIGEEYIIPSISGLYTHWSQVDINHLPSQFVIKCNHDSGSVIICKDKSKFEAKKAEQMINYFLSQDYYHYENKQWAYKGIKRGFFFETLLEESKSAELTDFKFFCFNGKARCVFVVKDRFSGGAPAAFFDMDWNRLPFELQHPMYKAEIVKPRGFERMVEVSEKIAGYVGNPFTRIDLYEVNGKIYFGEITFYPDGGMGKFRPSQWDYTLGSWMDLSSLSLK